METSLYRDSQLEQELRGKIHEIANERHGGAVPADVQDRIATEERHIFGNSHGTLLAVAAVDPMELGLRWEGCLGLDGTRAPQFTLNVAGGLLEEMAAYLGELLPGYDPDAERPAIRLCPHALMDRVWSIRNSALLSTHNLTLCRNIRVETMDSTAPQSHKIRAQKARTEGKARCCRPY